MKKNSFEFLNKLTLELVPNSFGHLKETGRRTENTKMYLTNQKKKERERKKYMFVIKIHPLDKATNDNGKTSVVAHSLTDKYCQCVPSIAD